MIATVVYGALSAAVPVTSIIDLRIFRDFADDTPAPPYLVWSLLASVPDNHLSGRPPSDRYSVSIDVFSRDRAESDALVLAARDAMEGVGMLSSGPQSLGYDPSSELFRYTFTVDIHQQR